MKPAIWVIPATIVILVIGGLPHLLFEPIGAPSSAPARTEQQITRVPPGMKLFTGKVYPTGLLDRMPGRSGKLSSWREEPVLDAKSVVVEANRVLSGERVSAALQRFARDAGTTPGEFLNRQIDFYPGSIQITPSERWKLQRNGRHS